MVSEIDVKVVVTSRNDKESRNLAFACLIRALGGCKKPYLQDMGEPPFSPQRFCILFFHFFP